MKNLAIILPDGSVLDGIEKISFQLFNSIFDEEVLRGSYSSSLDIPNTPGNRKAMGFAEMPESNIKPSRTIKNVKARIAGQLVNCTLKILNATDKAYKATLLFGWGQFVEQLAETRLNQLSNLDTLYLGGTGTTGTLSLAQYGTATAIKMTSTTWIINGSGLT